MCHFHGIDVECVRERETGKPAERCGGRFRFALGRVTLEWNDGGRVSAVHLLIGFQIRLKLKQLAVQGSPQPLD